MRTNGYNLKWLDDFHGVTVAFPFKYSGCSGTSLDGKECVISAGRSTARNTDLVLNITQAERFTWRCGAGFYRFLTSLAVGRGVFHLWPKLWPVVSQHYKSSNCNSLFGNLCLWDDWCCLCGIAAAWFRVSLFIAHPEDIWPNLWRSKWVWPTMHHRPTDRLMVSPLLIQKDFPSHTHVVATLVANWDHLGSFKPLMPRLHPYTITSDSPHVLPLPS